MRTSAAVEPFTVLEEIAHFFHAVMNDDTNSVKHATLCRTRAAALVVSIDVILLEHKTTLSENSMDRRKNCGGTFSTTMRALLHARDGSDQS